MTTLLCEHADFDQLREDRPELAQDIDRVNSNSILDTICKMLVGLYSAESEGWQVIALQNLGLLLRSYPHLWTREDVTQLLDGIFASDNLRLRELVIRSLSEYLTKEHEKKAAEVEALSLKMPHSAKKRVDMEQLVGNTEVFADSSVSTQLIQRYLSAVLKGALNGDMPVTQRLSLDILSHTVIRGLSHPLQCLPALIALETANDQRIAAKAAHMHGHLASKHGTILAVRYLDHARAAFNFQATNSGTNLLSDEVSAPIQKRSALRGFRGAEEPRALLQSWYNLIKDRRQPRLDFIKAMTKVFDVDPSSDVSSETVRFAIFVADNLAVMEYKGQEELLLLIHELKTILSVGGMQALFVAQRTLEELEDEDVDGGILSGAASSAGSEMKSTSVSMGSFEDSPSRVGRRAVRAPTLSDVSQHKEHASKAAQIFTVVLLLRNHLKWLYNLPES
jgi:cohesin loading factor subunit SCC2